MAVLILTVMILNANLTLTLIILSTTTQVNDAIDKILSSRQTTCLIVAHRLSTIARAERIVVLEGAYVLLHYTFFFWS